MGNQQISTNQANSSVKTLRGLFSKMEGQIAAALPKHMTPERVIRIAMSTVQRSQTLMKCTPTSVVAATVEASQLGLEVNSLTGDAYLVPFRNKKTGNYEAQLIPGYRGLIKLARRSGEIVSISAHPVHQNDQFDFVYGIEERLEHRPCMTGDSGPMFCVYAVASFRGGGHQIEVMTKRQVDETRSRSKAANDGPWVTDYLEMARKTVVKKLCKYLPQSAELERAIAIDNAIEMDMDGHFDAADSVADATAEAQARLREKYAETTIEVDGETVDTETGEIAESAPVDEF